MSAPRLTATFDSAEAFAASHGGEMKSGGLLIRGASLPSNVSIGPCVVELKVAGAVAGELEAQIAANIPGVGVAVMFSNRPALDALAQRIASGEALEPAAEEEPPAEEEAPPPPGPMAERLKAMTVAEKMALGLSGDREARAYLLRDTNRALHIYVLRNPRLGLDEVVYAAKMASLAPDALAFIAGHKEWGVSPGVVAALVRNPKTPVPLVLKLLPRVSIPDLKTIAKGGARMPIVQAARKLLNG